MRNVIIHFIHIMWCIWWRTMNMMRIIRKIKNRIRKWSFHKFVRSVAFATQEGLGWLFGNSWGLDPLLRYQGLKAWLGSWGLFGGLLRGYMGVLGGQTMTVIIIHVMILMMMKMATAMMMMSCLLCAAAALIKQMQSDRSQSSSFPVSNDHSLIIIIIRLTMLMMPISNNKL